MGTLGILKVAMATQKEGKTPTKGILSLGVRLSGSHLLLFPFPAAVDNWSIST